jgi:hypothetical protein
VTRRRFRAAGPGHGVSLGKNRSATLKKKVTLKYKCRYKNQQKISPTTADSPSPDIKTFIKIFLRSKRPPPKKWAPNNPGLLCDKYS